MKNIINYKKVSYLVCNFPERVRLFGLCPAISAIEKKYHKKVSYFRPHSYCMRIRKLVMEISYQKHTKANYITFFNIIETEKKLNQQLF